MFTIPPMENASVDYTQAFHVDRKVESIAGKIHS
jgi:hypothetical protein